MYECLRVKQWIVTTHMKIHTRGFTSYIRRIIYKNNTGFE